MADIALGQGVERPPSDRGAFALMALMVDGYYTPVVFTSGQVSEMTNTPPSTLRRYVLQFNAQLSEEATRKRGRRFSERDVAVIAQVRELLLQGRSPEEVEDLLQLVGGEEDPKPEDALALVPSIGRALTEALNMTRSLRSEVAEYGSRLDRIEKWARGPWWRRVLGPPPE